MKSILLIDSEADEAISLRRTLAKFGFHVEIAASNRSVHNTVAKEEFDLILLEFNLQPGIEEDPHLPASAHGRGLGLIRELRAARILTPILVYSFMEGDAYEISSLDAGADDYIVKRTPLSTLLCRINAHIRRQQWDLGTGLRSDRRVQVGPCVLDRLTKTLWIADKTIRLTEREGLLLEKLASSPSRVFSPAEVLNEVWAESADRPMGQLLSTIKGLRRKLEENGISDLIERVGDVGYKLTMQSAS